MFSSTQASCSDVRAVPSAASTQQRYRPRSVDRKLLTNRILWSATQFALRGYSDCIVRIERLKLTCEVSERLETALQGFLDWLVKSIGLACERQTGLCKLSDWLVTRGRQWKHQTGLLKKKEEKKTRRGQFVLGFEACSCKCCFTARSSTQTNQIDHPHLYQHHHPHHHHHHHLQHPPHHHLHHRITTTIITAVTIIIVIIITIIAIIIIAVLTQSSSSS